MHLLFPLLLMATATFARNVPEFDDDLLGRMVVSKKKFPFLTPKQNPDLVHIYPTGPQLAAIKAAMVGSSQSALRSKRSMDVDDDGFPSDPSEAFGWFNNFQKFLGKFLKMEFSYEVLNSTVIDPASLPFDEIKSDAYFKAMVIDKEQYQPYLENEFNPRMRNIAQNEKPWLPAEKLIQEMKECIYFKYGSASDEDFDFNKETGGRMVYYKVTCMRVKDTYYVGLSTYDNKFKLKDIERVETRTSGWGFFGIKRQKMEIHRWFEKRYLTLSDLKTLLDFIMNDFAERIRMEYREYLAAANLPVHE